MMESEWFVDYDITEGDYTAYIEARFCFRFRHWFRFCTLLGGAILLYIFYLSFYPSQSPLTFFQSEMLGCLGALLCTLQYILAFIHGYRITKNTKIPYIPSTVRYYLTNDVIVIRPQEDCEFPATFIPYSELTLLIKTSASFFLYTENPNHVIVLPIEGYKKDSVKTIQKFIIEKSGKKMYRDW